MNCATESTVLVKTPFQKLEESKKKSWTKGSPGESLSVFQVYVGGGSTKIAGAGTFYLKGVFQNIMHPVFCVYFDVFFALFKKTQISRSRV